MGDTNWRGPIGAMGSLEVQGGTAATIEPLDGPSYFYQGAAVLDPRGAPFAKDGLLPARVPAFLISPDYITVDAIPQAAATNVLAAAQVVTSAVPMALATVGLTNFSAGACSIAVGVPIIPAGTTSVVSVIALDFGFTTGTTAANSSTINVNDTTLFSQGQWIIVGNVANSGATQSLITQVQSIANATQITVAPSPATALGAPIGAANLWGSGLLPLATQFGPSAPAATAHAKVLQAGLLRVHNPAENLARNISVTANSSTSGTAQIIITGYDVWNNLMTELVTASGTTTVFGKKGFKYLASAVPQQTQGASYTLGIGDTFEFPIRADRFEQVTVWAGNTSVVNNVGFTAAATTSPATNTTGDVRGTIQLSGNGAGTQISQAATTNNVLRLVVQQTPSASSQINATPLNTVPLFGVPNSTT